MDYNYVMTATKHATLAKQNQPSASVGETDTKQQQEEYMDMTESSKEAAALSGTTKEQLEEYMEMSDNNKGIRGAEQELGEYTEMNYGKAVQDSNKIQEDGSMYIDLETVQEYEVPVNVKKPSSDLTYLWNLDFVWPH